VISDERREIATLAAAGLTNKQIGERLYLSHRTVATHLYQMFPKLGVTSRAPLRDALSGREDRVAPSPLARMRHGLFAERRLVVNWIETRPLAT
jgi:hypothetical protein